MTKASRIEGRAADWIIRSERRGFTSAMQAQLNDWLQKPRNRAEYLRLKKTWQYADLLRGLHPSVATEARLRMLEELLSSSGLGHWRDLATHDEIHPEAADILSNGPLPVVDTKRNELVLKRPPLEVMLQAVVTLGDKTDEGRIIEAATIPWCAFVDRIRRDPNGLYEIDWRKWEEIIAAAYSDAGYTVVLTNRSGDKGRDIMATKRGLLSIRYFDQVKAYAPGNLVRLDQVHSMLGVLSAAPNVSKGIITTTSDFAPGVYTDPEVQRFMPYRLDLRPRDRLLEWLTDIARKNGK